MAEREEQLDYCRDYFDDFIEYAETYVPEIVDEFCHEFDWRYKKWLKDGVTVRFGGKHE